MTTTARVSVIVPVYNDPEGIADTLESLYVQTYGDYEVLPVDNGSTDGGETTDAIARMAMLSDRIRPFEQTDTQGSYAARNTGIENARGDLLFFLDCDMTVEKTWIADCVAAMDRTGALYAGCNIDFSNREKALQTIAGRYELAFGFPMEEYIEHYGFALTGALLVRRETFDRVGTFDSALQSGGDSEFGNRVGSAGIEQHYFGDITVYHPPRTSLIGHWNRNVRIGRGMQARSPRDVTDPELYLPNAWPWRARDQLAEYNGGRDASEWPLLTVLELYFMLYLIELGKAVGRISTSLSPGTR